MSVYYEIRYPTGAVVQRVAALTDADRTTLAARGYKVREQKVSPTVWPWLLGPDEVDEVQP
jgi:hypothetical protein